VTVLVKAAIGLAVLLFLAAMVWATSPWVRGQLRAALWDGTSPLLCAGKESMTLRARTVRSQGPLLQAAGDCRLRIEDCVLTAPMVLDVAGNARVTVVRSRLEGKVVAAGNGSLAIVDTQVEGDTLGLEVSGDADVSIQGGGIKAPRTISVDGNGKVRSTAELSCPVQVQGNGRLTGTPALGRAQATRELSDRYSGHACDGVLDCYARAGAYGNISGRLEIAIGADGRATGATYVRGEAPTAVQDCLVAWAKAQRVDGYGGGLGHLSCEYAGNYLRGTQRMTYERRFTGD